MANRMVIDVVKISHPHDPTAEDHITWIASDEYGKECGQLYSDLADFYAEYPTVEDLVSAVFSEVGFEGVGWVDHDGNVHLDSANSLTVNGYFEDDSDPDIVRNWYMEDNTFPLENI